MSMTTKDSPFHASPDLSAGSDKSGAGGAVGLEVPVIVHASRYSSSVTGGKTLPPVHEETRTVIVFDQGAVVRLSAAMAAGEVVVLTNKLTGADVICKVANVKAQPGIQNYVSLEFTQRAPGFWGGLPQANRVPQVEAVPSVVAPKTIVPVSVAPAPLPVPSTIPVAPVVPVAPIAPIAPVAVAQVAAPPSEPVFTQRQVASAASYEHEAVAQRTVETISSLPPAPVAAPPAAKLFEAGATLGLRQSSPPPVNLRPIELAMPSRSLAQGNKNLVLIGVAASVLLVVGGVGGWFLLRPNQSAAPVGQSADRAPENLSAQSQPVSHPDVPIASEALLTPAASEVTSSGAELRPDRGSERNSEPAVIQSAATKSASKSTAAMIPAVSSDDSKSASTIPAPQATPRAVLDIGKMAAPSVKKRAVVSNSSDAPPELLAQSGAIAGNSLNENLFPTSARNSVPAPPPASGGQMVQPKLISSSAAVYPSQARAQHVQGEVAIDAFVDESGNVAAAKAISGPILLQQAAISAVRSWKYQPARLDGKPITIHIRVNVVFHLN